MSEKKTYRAETGIALDSTFLYHAASCEQCKLYDESKPATLALQCLEGSVLWKREHATPVSREQGWKPDTVVSKDEAKRAMKYK